MKKAFAMILALCMIFALCACGQTAAPAAAPAEAPAAAPAAAPAEAPAAEAVTLTYWSMWEATEPQGIAIKEEIDKFVAETGINVDVQFKGRQGIRQGLQPALDAHTEIDLFDEGVDRVNSNWGDYIISLEDYFASSSLAEHSIEAFVNWSRDAGNGTLKVIPYQLSTFCFCYNKDIFAEAGITEVPTDRDSFIAACEAIRAAGYDPICGDNDYICSLYGYSLGRLIGEEAAENVYMNGAWKDVPEALEAAKFLEELASKNCFSALISSSVWPNAQNMEIGLGTAAMYLNGSWLPNEIRGVTGDDFPWGAFSFPDLGGVDGNDANNCSFQCFAINKESQHQDEAFKLIEWLTTGEADQHIALASWGIPADPANTEVAPAMKEFADVCAATNVRYQYAVGAENNGDTTGALTENLMRLCGGQITAEEFIEAMAAAY